MTKRIEEHYNVLGRLIVEALELEFAVMLSEVQQIPADKIISNYRRKVRRGQPGLTRAFVKEEAIRRMAKEASCYTVHYLPNELLEEVQHTFRKYLRESDVHKGALLIWEYYFPLDQFSHFSSPKYRKKAGC